MDCKNLIGKQVTHKKFGFGTIIEVVETSYVNISFNGIIKKFSIDSLDLFFAFADQNFAKSLIEENLQIRAEKKILDEQRKETLMAERLKQKEEQIRLAKEAQKQRQQILKETKKLTQKDGLIEKQPKQKRQNPKDCLEIKDGVLIGLGSYKESTLKIPSNVTSIGENAFKNADLTRVVIPDTTTLIGKSAFEGCALKSIVIGKGVKEICKDAFAKCKNITRVSFKGTVDEWSEINFHSVVSNPTIWSRSLYINNKLVTNSSLTNTTKANDLAFLGWDAQININLM